MRLAPATFMVNTTVDAVATNLKTGQDMMGQVTLRGAIQAANHLGGTNTINVPAGSYPLTLFTSGDLSINDDLTINGAGSAATAISGNVLDRVFEIVGGKVTISNLTVEHGNAPTGGGIMNDGGQVTLSAVQVQDNTAYGGLGTPAEGGGVFNSGTLTILNSTINNNRALGAAGVNGSNGAAAQGSVGLSATGGNGQNGSNG